MKRIPRNPAKFDIFELFHALAERDGFSVNAPTANEQFLDAVARALRENKNNRRLIYGKRTELMFGFIAAALGEAKLIRHEDSGELFVSDSDLQPPDYRVVLKDGLEFFVEVKNFRQPELTSSFMTGLPYVAKLEKYAALFGKDLRVAIYWARWNLWTLIGTQAFAREGDSLSIDMCQAVKHNEMSRLGDYMLATRPPLTLKVLTDPRKPRFVDRSGHCTFTIGGIELHSGSTRIEDAFEKQLALSLMLYGRWNGSEPQFRVDDGLLSSIDVISTPEQRIPGEEFEVVDYLSGIMSARYRAATTSDKDGQVAIRPSADPDFIDFRVPRDYEGKQLPLCRLIAVPHDKGRTGVKAP